MSACDNGGGHTCLLSRGAGEKKEGGKENAFRVGGGIAKRGEKVSRLN